MTNRPLKDDTGVLYYIGYDLKDALKPHFLSFMFGIDDEMKDRANEVYRANAAKTSIGGSKMNKNPFASRKELEFTVGNLHRLCTCHLHRLCHRCGQDLLVVCAKLCTLHFAPRSRFGLHLQLRFECYQCRLGLAQLLGVF